MANYSLDNFIKTPVDGDKKLEIYNSAGNLMYMLEPLDVNFYYRNNKVVIHQLRTRIERESCRDHSYAELDFDTQDIASQAVIVANDAKNLILTFTDYYNTGEIDEMFSNISLNDLDDVNTGGTINGYYLSYSGGTWIGVPDSTDLSNYYTKSEVYNSGQTDILFQNYYTSGETDEIFENYYTSGETNEILNIYYTSGETDQILENYSLTGHTHSDSDIIITFPENPNDGDVYLYENKVYVYDNGWYLRPNAKKQYSKTYFLATKYKPVKYSMSDIDHHPEMNPKYYEDRFSNSFCEICNEAYELLTDIKLTTTYGVSEWMQDNIVIVVDDVDVFEINLILKFYDIVDSDMNMVNGRFGNPLYGIFKGRDNYLTNMVGFGDMFNKNIPPYDRVIDGIYYYFFDETTEYIDETCVWYQRGPTTLYNQPLIGSYISTENNSIRYCYDPDNQEMILASGVFQVGEPAIICMTDISQSDISLEDPSLYYNTEILDKYAILIYPLMNENGYISFYIKPVGINIVTFYDLDINLYDVICVKESKNSNMRFKKLSMIDNRIKLTNTISKPEYGHIYGSKFPYKIKFIKKEKMTNIIGEISNCYFQYNGNKSNIPCYIGRKD